MRRLPLSMLWRFRLNAKGLTPACSNDAEIRTVRAAQAELRLAEAYELRHKSLALLKAVRTPPSPVSSHLNSALDEQSEEELELDLALVHAYDNHRKKVRVTTRRDDHPCCYM